MLLLGMRVVYYASSDKTGHYCVVGEPDKYFFKVLNSYMPWHHDDDRRVLCLAALAAFERGEPHYE